MWTNRIGWLSEVDAILDLFQYSFWKASHTHTHPSHYTFNSDNVMPFPSYANSHHPSLFLCVFAYCADWKQTLSLNSSKMAFINVFGVFMSFWSPLTPFNCPWYLPLSNQPHSTHFSQPPKGPWLHHVSFQALCPDNTNHQNTLVHKPRLQPSGYALVNLSITLKTSGPFCCPDTNTHPTQPKS